MKSTKKPKLNLSKIIIEFSISIVVVYLMITLLVNRLRPTIMISSTVSPDRSMKVEFFSQGSLGRSWVDLITLDKFRNTKTEVYSEAGDELIFPKDLQVFWSEDSSAFLAISKTTDYIWLRGAERDAAKLASGESLMLMYNIPSKKLVHNLYTTHNYFYKDDIRKVKWHNCSVCQ
jgi:hypothetical protein